LTLRTSVSPPRTPLPPLPTYAPLALRSARGYTAPSHTPHRSCSTPPQSDAAPIHSRATGLSSLAPDSTRAARQTSYNDLEIAPSLLGPIGPSYPPGSQ